MTPLKTMKTAEIALICQMDQHRNSFAVGTTVARNHLENKSVHSDSVKSYRMALSVSAVWLCNRFILHCATPSPQRQMLWISTKMGDLMKVAYWCRETSPPLRLDCFVQVVLLYCSSNERGYKRGLKKHAESFCLAAFYAPDFRISPIHCRMLSLEGSCQYTIFTNLVYKLCSYYFY